MSDDGAYAPGWSAPLPFATRFDAVLASEGVPAIFTLDPAGQLRLSPTRTREAWESVPAGETPRREPCWCLLRDRATGWVMLVLATAPALCARHPRADVARYPSAAAALAALRDLGRPPVWRGPWPPA